MKVRILALLFVLLSSCGQEAPPYTLDIIHRLLKDDAGNTINFKSMEFGVEKTVAAVLPQCSSGHYTTSGFVSSDLQEGDQKNVYVVRGDLLYGTIQFGHLKSSGAGFCSSLSARRYFYQALDAGVVRLTDATTGAVSFLTQAE